ncbi:MAG: glucokinase, partial [Deltaproteobacteria bacterium]
LALMEIDADRAVVVQERRYESRQFEDFGAVVARFVAETGAVFERAGFGIAGPVIDGVCKATNLPWVIDARGLSRQLGVPAAIVNDFVAVARGVGRLSPADLVCINPGERVATAPIAILGAGTGLGEAFLVWNGASHDVVSSEGGHADFAPRDERQIGLLRRLLARYGHASYERVVSGMGLVEIYECLREAGVAPEGEAVRAALDRGEDLGAVVGAHALAGDDALSEATIDLFVDVYGAEAGNVALKVVARGGVYLAGGIAPKILSRLTDGRFRAAFVDKGRFRALMETIPVWVVTHPEVGLVGAASAAVT